MLACVDIDEMHEESAFFVRVLELLLWWFSGQVGDQRGDGTDIRYDSKHNGEHWEPQSLAWCCVGPLKIPLSRCLVGLGDRGEESEIRIRGGKKEERRAFVIVCQCLPWPPLSSSTHYNHTLSPYYVHTCRLRLIHHFLLLPPSLPLVLVFDSDPCFR